MMERGYVVVRLSERDGLKLREVARAGVEFFEAPKEIKESTRQSYSDCGGLGLIGFNEPHEAKQVLRLRRGAPIPSFPILLRPAALSAFDVVEKAALGLWQDLSREIGLPLLRDLGVVVGAGSSVVSSSPFDLMYYPNNTSKVNSTPHFDSPGLLTVVPVSSVPGLAVFDQKEQDWIEVERCYEPFVDCVVMAASSLQILSQGTVTAATHEVRTHTSPRLSLVYELRPDMNIATKLI